MKKLLLALAVLTSGPASAQLAVGWTALPNTTIKPYVCPSGTQGDCSSVANAWSGATYDTLRDRMLVFGGGHGDYNGNELYAVYPPGSVLPTGVTCSAATAPAVCRIINPSSSANLRSITGTCFDDTVDGSSPNDRHTYQGLTYIAHSDKLMLGGGAVTSATGCHFGSTWTLTLTGTSWAKKDPANKVGSWLPQDFYNASPSFTGQGPYVVMVYDPVSRLVFRQEATGPDGNVASGFIWSYNDQTNTYTQLGNGYTFYDHSTWVVDPKRRKIFMIGNKGGPNAGDATTSLGTPAIRSLDISNPASMPNVTVDLTTAADATCHGLLAALNPGVAYSPTLDRIVGWPGFGNTVFIYNPDTNSCTTKTYSGGPPDATNAGGSVAITGTFGRFQYVPSQDAFMVLNDAKQNAYMLKLPSNQMTITNTGSNATNYPVQVGRLFAKGEIGLGSLPQVSVDGSLVATQVDVKSRWSDNSLKHAVISFLIPTFNTGQTSTISFAAGTTAGNTALTKSAMLAAGYNFDAVISLTKSGVTKTASARTMLNNDDYTVWNSGPIATTILLGNHAQNTTCNSKAASAYDFGFDSYCAFRPLFEATFWPTINKVYVRYIGEVSNTEQLEDVPVDSMQLTAGNTSPTTVYTRGTALTMYMGTRWTRTTWIGGAPPVASYNHNLAYLAYSKAVPNYNPYKYVSASKITSAYSTWTAAAKDLYDAGEWTKAMGAGGGRDDIGPYPSWVVRWLYTGDYRMQEEALGQADLAGAWAFHFREGKSGKFLDRSHTVSGIGHPISVSTRPTISIASGYNYSYTVAADQLIPVGTYTDGGWTPEVAHQPDPFSVPYTLTGDYFYLEQMNFWASWTAANPNGAQTNGPNGRGPTGAEGGMPGYGSLQTRGQAWGFRSRVQTAFLNPDAMPEQAYFTTLANDAIAIWEGQRSVTGTSYQGTANWNWGATYHPYGSLGRPVLHHWDMADNTFTQYPADPTVTDIAVSTWEQNFVIFALGRGKELGFPTGGLLNWVGSNLISQATDSTYNPWLLGAYRLPLTSLATGTYFTNWAGIKSGFVSAAQTGTSFAPMYISGDCTTDASNCYPYFAAAAITMVTDQPSGTNAWDWANTNIQGFAALNDEPKWALLPRLSSQAAAPCSIATASLPTATVGQVYNVALGTNGTCASSSWGGWATCSGISLNSATGILGGTVVSFSPSCSGNVTFDTAVKALTVTINPTPSVLTGGSLTAGSQGVPYSQSLSTTGGTGALTCSLVAGSLPTGLAFSGCTITGTPNAASTYTFTVKATDTNNVASATSAPISITITGIAPPPTGNNGGVRKGGIAVDGGIIRK